MSETELKIAKEQNRIDVKGNLIGVMKVDGLDYICITDMVKNSGDETSIYNWLRNRNTVEFLGIWEQIHNENFKPIEFDRFRKEAGLNNFSLSPKKWIDNTGAIGIIAKSGKNGGTYAHQDIAFEFGAWLSAEFKLLLIKEFQRLKQKELELEQWDFRRFLSKVNYKIHTDSIKDGIIPTYNFPKDKEWLIYSGEADLLNMAVFGCTANQWREKNPELVKKGLNMRDYANIAQLTVLANIESQKLIRRYPWHSVDSTSAVMTAAMGRVYYKDRTLDFAEKTNRDYHPLEEKAINDFFQLKGPNFTLKAFQEDYKARIASNVYHFLDLEHELTQSPPVFIREQMSLFS